MFIRDDAFHPNQVTIGQYQSRTSQTSLRNVILCILFPLIYTLLHLPPLSHREAWRAEAPLVRGRACSSGDSPKEKPCGAASPREGGLRALPRTLPPAGEQPARLEGHQVLRPQPHPAAEEAGEEGKRCCGLLGQNTRHGRGHIP